MNPCPCGHYGSPRGQCRCDAAARIRYLGKLSGPLLDRIDLHVNVPPVDASSLRQATAESGESTAELARRVAVARARQSERKKAGVTAAVDNSDLGLTELERIARLDAKGSRLIEAAFARLGLSARSYVRTLRVARTIADLDDAGDVREEHVGEAVCYRALGAAPAAQAASSITRIPAEPEHGARRKNNGRSRPERKPT
jgi:magnesium chelatase family protein